MINLKVWSVRGQGRKERKCAAVTLNETTIRQTPFYQMSFGQQILLK
jgi:hypothetical protein